MFDFLVDKNHVTYLKKKGLQQMITNHSKAFEIVKKKENEKKETRKELDRSY